MSPGFGMKRVEVNLSMICAFKYLEVMKLKGREI